MTAKRTFVGFGFGPIQSALFVYEAFKSGNFDRLVVAEVMPQVVDAIRSGDGNYRVNVATPAGIEVHEVRNVEIYNPQVAADAELLIDAIAEASELSTALPSVDFFDRGSPSVARLLALGFRKKTEKDLCACVIYAGENHNHAAELLDKAVAGHMGPRRNTGSGIQFLNTVIGKMSGVVTDTAQIEDTGLAPMVEGWDRAFLIEEFNRILVSKIILPGFRRGIEVFMEKPDLLPFEEAKLYGHNAVHALIGYVAARKGHEFMSDVAADTDIMGLAAAAFIEESGRALIARHAGVDDLFTEKGYRAYAEDLLARMMNPHLRDAVARVTRDPRRKMGWDDRLVGTMRIALDAGIEPERFAVGAAAALEMLKKEEPGKRPDLILDGLWPGKDSPPGRKNRLKEMILGR